MSVDSSVSFFFFFNDTATTEIYTLSLHDALPISRPVLPAAIQGKKCVPASVLTFTGIAQLVPLSLECVNQISKTRSEEHTSELQSRLHLVCRLLLEKKKQ